MQINLISVDKDCAEIKNIFLKLPNNINDTKFSRKGQKVAKTKHLKKHLKNLLFYEKICYFYEFCVL